MSDATASSSARLPTHRAKLLQGPDQLSCSVLAHVVTVEASQPFASCLPATSRSPPPTPRHSEGDAARHPQPHRRPDHQGAARGSVAGTTERDNRSCNSRGAQSHLPHSRRHVQRTCGLAWSRHFEFDAEQAAASRQLADVASLQLATVHPAPDQSAALPYLALGAGVLLPQAPAQMTYGVAFARQERGVQEVQADAITAAWNPPTRYHANRLSPVKVTTAAAIGARTPSAIAAAVATSSC